MQPCVSLSYATTRWLCSSRRANRAVKLLNILLLSGDQVECDSAIISASRNSSEEHQQDIIPVRPRPVLTMEAPVAPMQALSVLSAAPTAENEAASQSFVPAIAQPVATSTQGDEDEWEYEYSTTEFETVYLTLDLTTPSIPTSRPLTVSSRNGRAGFRAKWLNPGLGRRKHLLGQAPTLSVKKKGGEDSDDDDEAPEMEDEDAVGETDPEVPKDGEGEEDAAAAEQFRLREEGERKVQILDLESDNPLVSYRDHIFTCQWARNIGTELLFASHKDASEDGLPTLRQLPGGVDLLAACSARIVSNTATLVPKAEVGPTELQEESDGPLVESVSLAASDDRRKQARFLERMMKIKKEKGENDEVTVVAYKRLRWNGWIELLAKRRAEERESLKRRMRKADTNAERDEVEKRLKELDEEEKNVPIEAPHEEVEGDDADEAAKESRTGKVIKRRRAKRKKQPVITTDLPEGTALKTGERGRPVRRRPRGEWKRYNLDGTIRQPAPTGAPTVPGDERGTVWKGWHGEIEVIGSGTAAAAASAAPTTSATSKDKGKQSADKHRKEQDDGHHNGDGNEHITDAHDDASSHQASATVGAAFDHDFRDRMSEPDSSPFKSSSLKRSYQTDWEEGETDYRMGSSPIKRRVLDSSPLKQSHSFSYGASQDDGPRPGSSHGMGIGFRGHAPSAPGSVYGVGFRDEDVPNLAHYAPSAPGSVYGIGFGETPPALSRQGSELGVGFRDDHVHEAPGSSHGIDFRDDGAGFFEGEAMMSGALQEAPLMSGPLQPVGEQGARAGQQPGEVRGGDEVHAPPPGGWLGLLDDIEDIPQLPEN